MEENTLVQKAILEVGRQKRADQIRPGIVLARSSQPGWHSVGCLYPSLLLDIKNAGNGAAYNITVIPTHPEVGFISVLTETSLPALEPHNLPARLEFSISEVPLTVREIDDFEQQLYQGGLVGVAYVPIVITISYKGMDGPCPPKIWVQPAYYGLQDGKRTFFLHDQPYSKQSPTEL